MTWMLGILIFLSTFAFVEFVYFAAVGGTASRERARRRLTRIADPHAGVVASPESSLVRVGDPETSRGLSRAGLLEPLQLLLYRAGSPVSPSGFVGLSVATAAAGVALGGGLLGQPALAAALGGAGLLLPLLAVCWRKRARMRRFEAMLPDALDLLGRALRAGHALSAGLQMVGGELDEPVGPEFARVSEEVRLGLEMSVALQHLAERVDVAEMPFFVTALVIQRETGGNLAEIIDNLAQVMRSRQAMKGRIRAVTAQTRWSANLLLIAPFAFAGGMTVLRPGYVAPLWDTEAGRAIVGMSLVMVIVGWLLCRRLGVVRV